MSNKTLIPILKGIFIAFVFGIYSFIVVLASDRFVDFMLTHTLLYLGSVLIGIPLSISVFIVPVLLWKDASHWLSGLCIGSVPFLLLIFRILLPFWPEAIIRDMIYYSTVLSCFYVPPVALVWVLSSIICSQYGLYKAGKEEMLIIHRRKD